MTILTLIQEFSCCKTVVETSKLLEDLLLDRQDLIELEYVIRESLPRFRMPKNPIYVSDILKQVAVFENEKP